MLEVNYTVKSKKYCTGPWICQHVIMYWPIAGYLHRASQKWKHHVMQHHGPTRVFAGPLANECEGPCCCLNGPSFCRRADIPFRYLWFRWCQQDFLPYNKVLLAPTKTHRPAKVISTRKSGCWPLYTWVGLQTAQQKQTYAQIKIRFKLKW